MLKLNIYFLCSLFILMACNNSSNSISNVKTDSLVALPFFNIPDWTPEWINKEDSGYAKIHSIPSFSFKNQEGVNITEANVEGKIYVANFFYTKCRGICPKMITNMSLLQEAFKNDSIILLLSHTVTPELDSIAVLKKYAILNKVDSKKWHLLTGGKNEIYTLAKQQYFAGDSVGYYQTGNEFLHTENFILVDQKRRIRGVYNGTLLLEIDRIKEDIQTLKLEAVSNESPIK
ncbi:MAG: SCO family protein [Chitinophagaceae bacterium]|nr:SCO family protein [Chitinophagaceae bacterium]